MTSIAAPTTAFPTINPAAFRRPAAWFAALALVFATAVWIVLATSTDHANNTLPAQVNTVQVNGQPANQLCAPAPGTRFC